MNISINCKLSLSKKLRAIISKEATLTLVCQDIKNGIGNAILSLDSEEIKISIDNLGETSLILTPVEIAEESPNNETLSHASIFSTIPSKNSKEKVVSKIAAVNPPEKGQESRAIKEEVEVPKDFSQLKNPQCKKWIKNMEEFIEAINISKTKKSNIDISSAQNDREKAVLQELKDKDEAIDAPAWIVNDKIGKMVINDLQISMPMNTPIDLSNISAKRLAMSRDLKDLLKQGYVRFIGQKERDEFARQITGQEEHKSLEVFSNHREAEESFGNTEVSSHNPVISDESTMEVSEGDVDKPTEEESMVLNLTQDLPLVKSPKTTSSVEKRTSHGESTTPKNSNIRPIRKLE